ncbi:MAG: hypothetical protein JSU61_11485, partial [Fidelibacterota bacterium]
MKKLGLWLFIPLLVSSVLMGGEATGKVELEKAKHELAASGKSISLDVATITEYQNALALKSIFSRDRFSKAAPVTQARQIRQPHTYRHGSAIPWATRFQFARSSEPERPVTLQKGMGFAGLIGAEVLDSNGEPTSAYTVGDTISIVINYASPVHIELWVDEGDGLFDPETDLWFSPGGDEGDDEIIVQDGDEDDEDPTVGVWQITFDTGEMKEGGELFGIQGARLFLHLYSDALDTGTVTLDVLPPASTTKLSGEVDVLDPPGDAANAIVVAFPMSGTMEDGPETMFITLTDDTGHYDISIPDDAAGQEFMVFAMDVFGLYDAVFPVPTFHDPFV